MAVVVSYDAKATASRALTFIVRIFVDDTIAITVWTRFLFSCGRIAKQHFAVSIVVLRAGVSVNVAKLPELLGATAR
jgi:hypothetical protein